MKIGQKQNKEGRLIITDNVEIPQVRLAVSEDAVAIAQVHVSGWQYAYAGLLPDTVIQSQSVSDRADYWRKFISNPINWPVFLLTENDVVTGFASAIPARDPDVSSTLVSELAAIYLDNTTSGRGLGADLLTSCLNVSRNHGCTSMILWVLDGNSRALSFYHKHGFVEDGASKYEERLEANEIRMRLEIPKDLGQSP